MSLKIFVQNVTKMFGENIIKISLNFTKDFETFVNTSPFRIVLQNFLVMLSSNDYKALRTLLKQLVTAFIIITVCINIIFLPK